MTIYIHWHEIYIVKIGQSDYILRVDMKMYSRLLVIMTIWAD